jgi:AmmeMemoRadiSam system protein B
MNRQAVVAGQFYPGQPRVLADTVASFLAAAEAKDAAPTIAAMVPHAGYVYSGAVAGRTLGSANLAPTVVLLGPNHTGLGRPLAVWDEGLWELPGGGLMVDETLAASLIDAVPGCAADYEAHVHEHSLEVVLPFLSALNPATRIVPVAVSERRPEALITAGKALGAALLAAGRPVSLVVSSDMSHYVTQAQAKARDSLAVERMLALDPAGLYEVVRAKGISMCGVLPMTLALAAALEMGATSARLAAYATSGEASGDFERVVGYAGIVIS